jgi:hypothetical protein
MSTVVEFGIVEGFILDDLIAGVLDNTEYTLGGVVFQDITDKMVRASIGRGKSRDLDRYNSGNLTVELNNEDRAFDPLYTGSPFYPQVVPRKEIRVKTDNITQFVGVIDDWNFAYEPGGQSRAEIQATDDFTFLARQLVTAGTAIPQTSGARVTAVLDMPSVGWPAGRRDIDAGSSVLADDVFDGNALEYLQLVETSEQGALFIAKNGNLTFRSRLDATPTSSSLITFADDGTGIPYTGVSVNYGTELLVNTVNVTSNAGTAIAENTRSRTAYGIAEESLDTLVSTTEQLTNLADFIVQKYGDPEYRFDGISMNLDTMSAGDRADVLGIELGDVILLKFTPNGIGSPIQQYGQVINIQQDIETTRHDLRIGVASLDFTFLVLDDTVFGTMNNNSLAF